MKKKVLSLVLGLTLLVNPLTVLAETQTTTTTGEISCTVTASIPDPTSYTVTLPKTLEVTTSEPDKIEYEVNVQGSILDGYNLNVVPDETFTMTLGNDSKTVQVEQEKQSWGTNEMDGSVVAAGSVDISSLTTGSWVGNLNFTISLEEPVPETITYTAILVDSDGDTIAGQMISCYDAYNDKYLPPSSTDSNGKVNFKLPRYSGHKVWLLTAGEGAAVMFPEGQTTVTIVID